MCDSLNQDKLSKCIKRRVFESQKADSFIARREGSSIEITLLNRFVEVRKFTIPYSEYEIE